MKVEMTIGLMCHRPRNPYSTRNLRRERASRDSTVWLTPSFQLSGTDFGFLAFRPRKERERKKKNPVVLSLQMCVICYGDTKKVKHIFYNYSNKFFKPKMGPRNQVLKGSQKNLGKYDSRCLDFLEQTSGRNLDIKGDSGQSSEGRRNMAEKSLVSETTYILS